MELSDVDEGFVIGFGERNVALQPVSILRLQLIVSPLLQMDRRVSLTDSVKVMMMKCIYV